MVDRNSKSENKPKHRGKAAMITQMMSLTATLLIGNTLLPSASKMTRFCRGQSLH